MAELSVLMRPQGLRPKRVSPLALLPYYTTESVGYDQLPKLPYCL